MDGLRQMCLQERHAASGEARSYSALTQAPSEWEEVVSGSPHPTSLLCTLQGATVGIHLHLQASCHRLTAGPCWDQHVTSCEAIAIIMV